MKLEEILQKEDKNAGHIFLYMEDGTWYAYEHSAFYCYSLLSLLDMDWLSSAVEVSEYGVVRVRVAEPDQFLRTPLLRLLDKKKTEYVISCKIVCGGFQYWRDQLRMKFFYSGRNRDKKGTAGQSSGRDALRIVG
ncbi:hypothetical protein [Bacteroides sp. UBA939]|uniref:hypothetical protein n=1 Tax=Bacteroides sp. UBA939 TaxID=1946092 RepID=UPI0025C14E83|nr:hypothetical protein [Bacteroides sp. UBA939]